MTLTRRPADGRRPMLRQRLGYRPGLDGIRAVAVIAVMAFHGGVTWIPGGFLGVDLFFVLSGFLITTLLLEEWGTTGGVRLGSFWARRARRLFPALALLLAAVAVYGATLAPPATRSGLRWDGLASLFYVANWRFVFGHESYFAAFAVPSPLRHLWSLAVEEQWYLIWPPALAVLLHLMRRRVPPRRKLEIVLGLLAGLTLLSAGRMLRLDLRSHGAADSGRSYYGTDTHIQVLLVGAMLAVVWLRWPPVPPTVQRAWRRAGSVGAGVCLLMLLFVSGSDRWLYRGGFTLFALAGALVVAAVVLPRPGALARVLSAAPMRAVGRISYGLYLWHWPVDIVLNPTRVQLGAAPLLLVRTTVTAAVAMASYRCIERPIRTQRVVLRRPLRLSGVTVAVLVAALTVLPSIGAAAPPASPAAALPSRSAPTAGAGIIPALAAGQPVRVLVVGDSVGRSLTNGAVAPPPLEVTDASIEGCGITFGAAIVGGYPIYDVSQCPEQKQRRLWSAGLTVKPNVVVMSFGTWEVFDQEYDNRAYRVFSDAYRRLLTGQLQSDIDFLARFSNAHIVLLDVPCYHATDYGLGGAASPRNDPRRVAWVDAVFARVAAANPGRVALVPISQWACPGGRFVARRHGVVLRPDGVHYDPQSAALTWDAWLGPRLVALAHTPSRR